jgi:hypothetical protein
VLIVDAITESRSINNGQCDPDTVFFELDIDRLDPDALLEMGLGSCLRDEGWVGGRVRIGRVGQETAGTVYEHIGFTKGINKGCASRPGSTW